MSAFNIELPFPVRDKLRRRLSTEQVQIYRDIALTKGHIGRALEGVKDALSMESVEVARLADIMRQIDISSTGSLNRDDFYLALDQAGVSLQAEDKYRLFEALQSASPSRGCDIDTCAHLVNFWAGNAGRVASLTPPKDARDKYAESEDRLFPSTKPEEDDPSVGWSAGASTSGHSAVIRGSASRGKKGREVDRGALVFEDNGSSEVVESLDGHDGGEDKEAAVRSHEPAAAYTINSHSENINGVARHAACSSEVVESLDGHDGGEDKEAAVRSHEPAAAYTINSHSENINGVSRHAATAAGAEDRRSPVQRYDVTLAGIPLATASTPSEGMLHNKPEGFDKNHLEDVRDSRPSSELRRVNGTGYVGGTEENLPDEAYVSSLGHGNLGSVLSILLDRRESLEAFVKRLDRSGTGRVKSGDFMAAVREVGIALSPLQEGELMGMLERMDVVTLEEGGYRWVDIEAGLAAVALAGEKACGTIFRKKAALMHEEGTRLLEAMSAHYPDVHVALLPSALLLGPNAMKERRAARSDGADSAIVTIGSLQKALRTARVVVGDSGKRILWRLLLSRAQDVLRRDNADSKDKAAITRILDSGLIPLPILDKVMGFDAEEALRVRRELQQQKASSASKPPGYHESSWAMGLWTSSATKDEEKERNTLLRKARLRVKGLAETEAERERLLLQCLPRLGPTGESQRLPRDDLTRLFQQLGVSVRYGELQNLWYHMDRSKVTREGFRRLLLGSLDCTLPLAAFPGSPCPYPAGLSFPAFETSHDGNRTPPGGVSVSGARAQRELNRAAYEDNIRRAAGSAIPRFIQEEGRRGENFPESPRSVHSAAMSSEFEAPNEMPVLLRRAVGRVKEMGNGEEAVWALVPNTGLAKEGMQITRGDVQRVLHGLGVTPRSGELQQLWWYLERGAIGDPRISVGTFRAFLLGQIVELELLPRWSVSKGERSPSVSNISDEKNARGSLGKGLMQAAKAALGLVRRRVSGVIRECNQRDLSSDGWVTEGSFLAVLNDLGILRQLGDIGLTALRQAVVVDVDVTNGRDVTPLVRYSGLVGAIDRYLEGMAAWDEAEVASRLCASVNAGGKDIKARCGKSQEHMDSQDNVCRTTRGRGENNASPVVPLGMRHFPQESCEMAGLIGQAVIDGSARGVPRMMNAKGHVLPSSGMGTSTALRREEGASFEAGAAVAAGPTRGSYHVSSNVPGVRDALIWKSKGGGHATACRSSLQSKTPRLPSDERRRAYANFVPAGDASSIETPMSCGARRGMVNKMSNLSGTEVSRAICWVEGSNQQRTGRTKEPLIGSAAIAGDDVTHSHRDDTDGCNAVTDGKLQEAQLVRSRRRRDSNTDQVREVIQAWPESPKKADIVPCEQDLQQNLPGEANVIGSQIPTRDQDWRRKMAKFLLSDRALLEGVFKQLAGITGSQAPSLGKLDRARLVKLLEHPRLPSSISHQEAQDLADDVLAHHGTPAVRLTSLLSFLTKEADATHARAGRGEGASYGEATARWRPMSRSLQNDPIAQSIKRTVLQGHSDLRLAGGDAEERLVKHLHRAFRKRGEDLGSGADGNDSSDSCSVSASDLSGVLKDVGVVLNPNQTTFLIEMCSKGKTPGRRVPAGANSVKAGDMLAFFRELFSVD